MLTTHLLATDCELFEDILPPPLCACIGMSWGDRNLVFDSQYFNQLEIQALMVMK